MDDLNRSISNYVKSGQYYIDARKWYLNKFIFAVTQRSYIIVFLFLFAISLSVLWLHYGSSNPAPTGLTYVSPSPDVAKSYSVIFPAGEPTDNPQLQITKYMLSSYVTKRESYKFGNIKDQLAFVRNTSVSSEYAQYAQYMSINNPSSPLMLYQDSNVKEVDIKDVKIINNDLQSGQAIVFFVSSLRNLATNNIDSQDMVALIKFKIDNIEDLMTRNAKNLSFIVTSYNLQKDVK